MIQEVVARLGKMDKRTGRASDKTIEQCAGIAALFVELTRVADVRAIRQRHIAALVDGMDRMPPVYRRSAAARGLAWIRQASVARRRHQRVRARWRRAAE